MICEVKEPSQNLSIKNKGGRPKKAIKRDQQLAVMCSLTERKLIEYKAKKMSSNTSRYLRELALKGQVGTKVKVIPKEILSLPATLNRMASNLNQLARKNNRNEAFSSQEKLELQELSGEIKKLAIQLKKILQ
jgi:fumarate hydratase class II